MRRHLYRLARRGHFHLDVHSTGLPDRHRDGALLRLKSLGIRRYGVAARIQQRKSIRAGAGGRYRLRRPSIIIFQSHRCSGHGRAAGIGNRSGDVARRQGLPEQAIRYSDERGQ